MALSLATSLDKILACVSTQIAIQKVWLWRFKVTFTVQLSISQLLMLFRLSHCTSAELVREKHHFWCDGVRGQRSEWRDLFGNYKRTRSTHNDSKKNNKRRIFRVNTWTNISMWFPVCTGRFPMGHGGVRWSHAYVSAKLPQSCWGNLSQRQRKGFVLLWNDTRWGPVGYLRWILFMEGWASCEQRLQTVSEQEAKVFETD